MKRIHAAHVHAVLAGVALGFSAALGAGPGDLRAAPDALCHVPREGIDHTLLVADDSGGRAPDPADWRPNAAGRCFDTRGASGGEDRFALLVCDNGPGRSMGIEVEAGPVGRPRSRAMGCGSPVLP